MLFDLLYLSKSKSSQKGSALGLSAPLVVSTLTSSCESIATKLMSESIPYVRYKKKGKEESIGKNAIHQKVHKEVSKKKKRDGARHKKILNEFLFVPTKKAKTRKPQNNLVCQNELEMCSVV